jgi:hypothetical protein
MNRFWLLAPLLLSCAGHVPAQSGASGLGAPFNLGAGRVTSSPFAEAVLRTVIR